MNATPIEGEHRPELLERRGEAIAWLLALLSAAAWAWTASSGAAGTILLPVLAVLLALTAAAISLGNWMDRRTRLRITESGLAYENGLRRVEIPWSEVVEVHAMPTRNGKRVSVAGDKAFFTFRTLGEIQVGGEVKGRIGFVRGEEIFRHIVLQAGLQIVEGKGEGYSYVRPG
jgi:hypothetical protein